MHGNYLKYNRLPTPNSQASKRKEGGESGDENQEEKCTMMVQDMMRTQGVHKMLLLVVISIAARFPELLLSLPGVYFSKR